MTVFWSYFQDFVGAQKIEDLTQSKNFFAELFQITSRFVLAKKIFGVRCTLSRGMTQESPESQALVGRLLIRKWRSSCTVSSKIYKVKASKSKSGGSETDAKR